LAEAEKAIKNLDKRELDGREINVQLAKPRQVKPFSSNPEKKKKRKNNKKSRKNVIFFFFFI
jgi:RNA recognition motif-containing protein